MSDESFSIPSVVHRKRGRPSAVWIVPLVAIIAAGALAIRGYLETGPTIHIKFDTADGIEAGKSDVRYKNVPVGKVTSVDLAKDRHHIVATVELTRGGAKVASKDSVFWVERPRIGVGGVSGLGTLLSGAYIGVDLGASDEDESDFVGLEHPPGVTNDQRGKRFRITTTDAGSLAPQSPIYYQRQSVGSILSVEIAKDGKAIDMEVFVASPYDELVTESTVFWNTSGLDVTLDASGLRVDTQSLATVVAGGIEFGVRPGGPPSKPAPQGYLFTLFTDRRHAMALPDAEGTALEMRFDEPIRGTAGGVNVEFEGVHIGDLTGVTPDYDERTQKFHFDAHARVYLQRLGPAYSKLVAEGAKKGLTPLQTMQSLVARGLRAQIKSSNLLTGAYYVDLAWFPATKASVVARDDAWVVPTVAGGGEQMQGHLENILAKVDRIPFDQIGEQVAQTAQAANVLLRHLDTSVLPAVQGTMAKVELSSAALKGALESFRDNVVAPDSELQQGLRGSLEQLQRAAYSLRTLSDYLGHHPESLIRGRESGTEPK